MIKGATIALIAVLLAIGLLGLLTSKVRRAFNRKKKEDRIIWEGSDERKVFIETLYDSKVN